MCSAMFFGKGNAYESLEKLYLLKLIAPLFMVHSTFSDAFSYFAQLIVHTRFTFVKISRRYTIPKVEKGNLL